MKKLLAACSFVALMSAVPAQAASLIGDTVSCSQTGPSSTFSCFTSQAVVGGGQEFSVGAFPNQAIGIDFNGGGLHITNIAGSSLTLSETILTFTNLSNAFSSANLLNSSITGFNSSDILLQNGVLQLDFRGTSWATNSTANIHLDTAAAVPEPAAWAMMLLGLGAMGAAMRTRRRQAITVRYA